MATETTTKAGITTPAKGASADEIRAFLDRRRSYESPLRMRRASTWTKADLFRRGKMWLRPSFNTDPTKTPHWTELYFDPDDEDAVPMPVQPEIVVPLQNEAARLGAPDYEPYVRPEGEEPDQKAREGAKITERLLKHELEEMEWETIEAEGDLHMPLFGQAIYHSYVDTDLFDVTRVPVLTAKCCPHHPSIQAPGLPPEAAPDAVTAPPPPPCPFVTCEPEVDARFTSELPEAVLRSVPKRGGRPVAPDETFARADHAMPGEPLAMTWEVERCPFCRDSQTGEHPALVDYSPTLEEAKTGKDAFGRALGVDRPIPRWRVRVVSPYDLFIASQGIGVRFRSAPWYMFSTPMPLSFIASRWKNGHKVQAENPQAIMMWHPITGERAVYESGAYGDANIFDGFARVTEYFEPQATKAFPHGRYIAFANGVALEDGDFEVESAVKPGERYARAHTEVLPWEILPNECYGQSLAEWLFSLQEDINEMRSIDLDVLGRMGVMWWIARRAMNLENSGFTEGGLSGKVVEFDTDPLYPQAEPDVVGGKTLEGIEGKINFLMEAMHRIAGTNEIEGGDVPSGVTAALAMQFLAEKSGERRRNRILRKRLAFTRLFRHGALVMYHRYIEPRKLEFQDDDGRFKEAAYRGTQMEGQLKVRIDAEPEHDSPLQRKQQVQDLMQAGFYDMTDPATKDKIAEALEAPRDIDPAGLQFQAEAAAREFCEFRDEQYEPVVDPSLDDHSAHRSQHGKDMMGDWFRDLERDAGWERVLPYLYDWQQMFGVLLPVVMQAQPIPPAAEFQILAVWGFMLGERQPGVLERSPALQRVLRFRAHYEAHTMVLEQKQAAAQAGQVQAAAPQAPATMAGTMPTSGTVPVGVPAGAAPAGAPMVQ